MWYHESTLPDILGGRVPLPEAPERPHSQDLKKSSKNFPKTFRRPPFMFFKRKTFSKFSNDFSEISRKIFEIFEKVAGYK